MSKITVSDISKCKSYNVGYYRYKEKYKFKKPKENCDTLKRISRNCPEDTEEAANLEENAKEKKL